MKVKHSSFRFLIAAALLATGMAATTPRAEAASCADVLNSSADLSSFAGLVQQSGLGPNLPAVDALTATPI